MRLSFVEGASPDKWLRVWRDRHPTDPMQVVRVPEHTQWDALESGDADVAIVRLEDGPDALTAARERGFAVELYREHSALVVPRDHPYADAEALNIADAQELDPTPEQATVEDTLALCAAGVGAVTLPLSVARLFHRRDLSVIPLSDGPEWPVALVWRVDSERIQDFVGITRGRGAHSSR